MLSAMIRSVMWSDRTRLPTDSLDRERCGVLLGLVTPQDRLVIMETVAVPNRHPDPGAHFTLLHSDVSDATAHRTHQVVGHWHTHDEPVPASDGDIAGCGPLVGLAYHPETGYHSWFDSSGEIEIKQSGPAPWDYALV